MPDRTRLVPGNHLLLAVVLFLSGFGLLLAQDTGKPHIRLIGRDFHVLSADSPAERQKGLSGHPGLAAREAMLFTFEMPDKHCFWMKDMNFPIDILWFDDAGMLVHQARDVSPETFPEQYCPPGEARHVVEVRAGIAEELNLRIGDRLVLGYL